MNTKYELCCCQGALQYCTYAALPTRNSTAPWACNVGSGGGVLDRVFHASYGDALKSLAILPPPTPNLLPKYIFIAVLPSLLPFYAPASCEKAILVWTREKKIRKTIAPTDLGTPHRSAYVKADKGSPVAWSARRHRRRLSREPSS